MKRTIQRPVCVLQRPPLTLSKVKTSTHFAAKLRKDENKTECRGEEKKIARVYRQNGKWKASTKSGAESAEGVVPTKVARRPTLTKIIANGCVLPLFRFSLYPHFPLFPPFCFSPSPLTCREENVRSRLILHHVSDLRKIRIKTPKLLFINYFINCEKIHKNFDAHRLFYEL